MAQQALALMEAALDSQQAQVELLAVELLELGATNLPESEAQEALETMLMGGKAGMLEHLQQTL
jgi:hypothetical protein